MNRFTAFSLGVVITAASVGAVSYASAAGDANIKACANKATGAMRYIAKGKCKKTETSLSWNQMGQQGSAGPQGATGAPGSRGETGSAGVNGQNLYAVDDAGNELGIVTQANTYGVTVLSSGGLWTWNTMKNESQDQTSYFRDASCTIPLGLFGLYLTPYTSSFKAPPQARFVLQKSASTGPTKAYQVTGQSFNLFTLPTIYEWSVGGQTCTARTTSTYFSGENYAGYNLTEVALPSYTPPIRIVQR